MTTYFCFVSMEKGSKTENKKKELQVKFKAEQPQNEMANISSVGIASL